MKSRFVLTAVFAAVGLVSNVSALEITMDYAVVVPDPEPTLVAKWLETAAIELTNDIWEATGMSLPVVRASEAAKVRKAIFIGGEFARKAKLAGRLTADAWEPMENVVAEKDGNVYLFGYDCCVHPEAPERPDWRYRCLPSVRAVCNFMEKELGVFIGAPGRTGRDVPKLEKLEIADGTFRREKPRVISGIGRFHEMVYDIANGFFGFCRTFTYGGHTYPKAVPRTKYFATHPEYFPFDGKMRITNDVSNALCISNPDVERLIVEEVVRKLDSGVDMTQLGQQDSKVTCQCERCKAFGGTDDWGEKYWIFHRNIAGKVYRLRPNKTVHILSYMATKLPPKSFREFPPNVMIELTENSDAYFRMWSKYKVPKGFTNYIYMFGAYRFLGHTPRCSIRHMAREARRYAKAGMRATYRCDYGDLFGLDGQGYYVFNRMLLDPTLDENELAKTYVQRMYGPANETMARFHRQLDMRVSAYSKIREGYPQKDSPDAYPSWTGRPADYFAYMYPKDMMDWFNLGLNASLRQQNLSDKVRRRISLCRLEYDYVENLAKTIHFYNAYRMLPTEEMWRPLAESLRERQRYFDRIYDAKGNMKPIPGWPEMVLFNGVRCDNSGLRVNGWGDARMTEPFGWDPEHRPTSFK